MLSVNDPSSIIAKAVAGAIAEQAHREQWTNAQIVEKVDAKAGQWGNLDIQVSRDELAELVADEMINLRCPERR